MEQNQRGLCGNLRQEIDKRKEHRGEYKGFKHSDFSGCVITFVD